MTTIDLQYIDKLLLESEKLNKQAKQCVHEAEAELYLEKKAKEKNIEFFKDSQDYDLFVKAGKICLEDFVACCLKCEVSWNIKKNYECWFCNSDRYITFYQHLHFSLYTENY